MSELDHWGASVRLSAAEAADIFRQIVTEPAPSLRLEPRWWRQYSASYTAAIVASTRPPRWHAA